MKKILILIGVVISGMAYGQVLKLNGHVDAYSKTQSDAKYLLKSGFTMEASRKDTADSMLVINNGQIAYGLAQDLNVTPQQMYSGDTIHYWLPLVNNLALGTGTYAINTLRAFCIYCPINFVFDGYAIDVTTGASSGALIMGIYSDTIINSKHYPSRLLYKTDVIDASTAAVITKNAIPSPYIVLKGGTCYWYAISTNNSSIAIRGGAVGSMPNILGWTTGSSGATKVGWYVSRNYDGDLPSPFPDISGATTVYNAALPLLFLKQR